MWIRDRWTAVAALWIVLACLMVHVTPLPADIEIPLDVISLEPSRDDSRFELYGNSCGSHGTIPEGCCEVNGSSDCSWIACLFWNAESEPIKLKAINFPCGFQGSGSFHWYIWTSCPFTNSRPCPISEADFSGTFIPPPPECETYAEIDISSLNIVLGPGEIAAIGYENPTYGGSDAGCEKWTWQSENGDSWNNACASGYTLCLELAANYYPESGPPLDSTYYHLGDDPNPPCELDPPATPSGTELTLSFMVTGEELNTYRAIGGSICFNYYDIDTSSSLSVSLNGTDLGSPMIHPGCDAPGNYQRPVTTILQSGSNQLLIQSLGSGDLDDCIVGEFALMQGSFNTDVEVVVSTYRDEVHFSVSKNGDPYNDVFVDVLENDEPIQTAQPEEGYVEFGDLVDGIYGYYIREPIEEGGRILLEDEFIIDLSNQSPEISAAIADPATVDNSGSSQTEFRVTAVDVDGTIESVYIDLDQIDGESIVEMTPDTGDDFVYTYTIPISAPHSTYQLPIVAVDDRQAGVEGVIDLIVEPFVPLDDEQIEVLGFRITASHVEETTRGTFIAENNVTMEHISSGLILKLEAEGGLTVTTNPPLIESQGEVILKANLGILGIYDLFHGDFTIDGGGLNIDEQANRLLDDLVGFVLDTNDMDIDLILDGDPGIQVTADIVLDIIDGQMGNDAPRCDVTVTARMSGEVSGSLSAEGGINWNLAAGTLSVDSASWENQTITIQDAMFDFSPGTFDEDRIAIGVPELIISPEGISADGFTLEDLEFHYAGFGFDVSSITFANDYCQIDTACVNLPIGDGFKSCVYDVNASNGELHMGGGSIQVPPLTIGGYDLASINASFYEDAQGNRSLEASGGLTIPVMGELGIAFALDSSCEHLLTLFRMEMDLGPGIPLPPPIPMKLSSVGGEIKDLDCDNAWIFSFMAGFQSIVPAFGDVSLYSADVRITLDTDEGSFTADGAFYIATFQMAQAGLGIYPDHFYAYFWIEIFPDPWDFIRADGQLTVQYDPFFFEGEIDGRLQVPAAAIPIWGWNSDVEIASFHGLANSNYLRGEFKVLFVGLYVRLGWDGSHRVGLRSRGSWLFMRPGTDLRFGVRRYTRGVMIDGGPEFLLTPTTAGIPYHGARPGEPAGATRQPLLLPRNVGQWVVNTGATGHDLSSEALAAINEAFDAGHYTFSDTVVAIDVPPDSPRLIFHIAELPDSAGTELDVTLLAPSEAIIDSVYCAENEGFYYDSTVDHIFYGIDEPEAGSWRVIIDDIDPKEDYLVEAFFENERPVIELLEPSVDLAGTTDDEYVISWSASDTEDDPLSVSLIALPDTTRARADSLNTGPWLIAEALPDSVTTFTWRPENMKDGTYRVVARVEDNYHAMVVDTCEYTITLTNQDAPSAPGDFKVRVGPEKVRLSWDRCPENDVIGYRFFYSHVDSTRVDTLDIGNVDRFSLAAIRNYESYKFWIEAYDVMGRYGPVSDTLMASPSPLGDADPPDVPAEVSYQYDRESNVINLNWTESEEAVGYYVHYDTNVISTFDGTGALEGDSPILQGRVGSLTLTDLPPGKHYYISVTSLDAAGNESRLTVPVPVLISEFIDTDEDGLPDDWENENLGTLDYGPDDDPDADLLDNETELNITKTHPARWDTDADQVPDGNDDNPLDSSDADCDGMPDDWENHYGIDDPQLDQDQDLLINLREYAEHCSPLDPDTDSDILGDGFEADSIGTDPWNPDTDGGGEWDGYEYFYGRDPLDPDDDMPDSGADEEISPERPLVTRLGFSRPNPSIHSVLISYSLATPEHVKIKIFDVTGREVRTLVDGQQSAGHRQIDWDGRSQSGSRVAAGIYYIRFQAGDVVQTRRATMIK